MSTDSIHIAPVAILGSAVPEPFIVDDIAEVVVAALTDPRHVNRLYEVTGPRALTFAQAVAEISAGLGRPVRYTQITPEQFVASLKGYVPEDTIKLLNELFTVVLDGRNTQVMPGVKEALGRAPRDFSAYVRNTVAKGTWGTERMAFLDAAAHQGGHED